VIAALSNSGAISGGGGGIGYSANFQAGVGGAGVSTAGTTLTNTGKVAGGNGGGGHHGGCARRGCVERRDDQDADQQPGQARNFFWRWLVVPSPSKWELYSSLPRILFPFTYELGFTNLSRFGRL
jgi:hypothetical protein